MKRKLMFLAAIVTVFSLHTRQSQAQSDEKKLEIGGQFSFLQVPTQIANSTGIVCVTLPCPTTALTRDTHTDFGFGPRIGYNATSYLTLEAEMNFFPRDRDLEGGRKVQGLFGAKAGCDLKRPGYLPKHDQALCDSAEGTLLVRHWGFALQFSHYQSAAFSQFRGQTSRLILAESPSCIPQRIRSSVSTRGTPSSALVIEGWPRTLLH